MSEGTSVGKIFLELDILADLKSQLESIASKAQGQAKSSFENVGKAASEAMQRPVEKMNKTVEKVNGQSPEDGRRVHHRHRRITRRNGGTRLEAPQF